MQPVLDSSRAPADILLDVWRRLGEMAAGEPPAQSAAEYLRAGWMERLGVTDDTEAVGVWATARPEQFSHRDDTAGSLDVTRPHISEHVIERSAQSRAQCERTNCRTVST